MRELRGQLMIAEWEGLKVLGNRDNVCGESGMRYRYYCEKKYVPNKGDYEEGGIEEPIIICEGFCP